MEWLELTIKTVSSAIELLGAKLTAIGYDSFIVDDSSDFQEFLEQNTQYWDYVDEDLAAQMQDVSQIRIFIEEDSDAQEKILHLKSELEFFRMMNPDTELGSLEISISNLKEEDWENSWKEYYHPIPIGRRILITPEWIDAENPEGRVKVMLDPGMIFGTGEHASTQMCLRQLEDAIAGGESVVDLGSGSGILSIAALLLGADHATGVDIDPKAEDIARENAALNNLHAPEFSAVTGNVLVDSDVTRSIMESKYDVVLANIVADVIIPLSTVVPSLMKENGCFICSGILSTRLAEVLAALDQAGLEPVHTEMQNDWCCVKAKLK